jgi:shikimate 5-dehydrogenase
VNAHAPPPRVGRLVLLGHPVGHSLSPRFQNAALQAAAIPLTYEALDVAPDAVAAALAELKASAAPGTSRCRTRSAWRPSAPS